MNAFRKYLFISTICWIFLITQSCIHPEVPNNIVTSPAKTGGRPRHMEKPPSASQDTLKIDRPAAIFYYPDSFQLASVKAVLDTSVYKGIMHDYFYQMRYDRKVIIKTWPSLNIIDSKNYRYLLFVNKNGVREYVDLNTKSDLYGLIVWNMKKHPLSIDMTNIDTQVYFYMNG